MNRIIKFISILFCGIVFVLLIKWFYFDTTMGYNTEILELNYSALPMFVDVIITVLITPFLVYGIMGEILIWIFKHFNEFLSTNI